MIKKIIEYTGFAVLIIFMCHLGYWGALIAGSGVAKFTMFCFIAGAAFAQFMARIASDEFLTRFIKNKDKESLDIPRLRRTYNYASVAFVLGAVFAYLGIESREAALDAAMRIKYHR
jgi:hypothetical protein